jgi:hypothetical protein
MPERDYLGAVRERMVAFDGGMGATMGKSTWSGSGSLPTCGCDQVPATDHV